MFINMCHMKRSAVYQYSCQAHHVLFTLTINPFMTYTVKNGQDKVVLPVLHMHYSTHVLHHKRLHPYYIHRQYSLLTFAGKAVVFRHVIIHVISVGRSHFSNNCHVI